MGTCLNLALWSVSHLIFKLTRSSDFIIGHERNENKQKKNAVKVKYNITTKI